MSGIDYGSGFGLGCENDFTYKRKVIDALAKSVDFEKFMEIIGEDGWKDFYVKSSSEEYFVIVCDIGVKFGKSVLWKLVKLNRKTDWEGMGK